MLLHGKAAGNIKEFYLLPVNQKLIQYDKLGINVIVANQKGTINSCDIPFTKELAAFQESYDRLTALVRKQCTNYEIEDHMIIGTSGLIHHNIDGVVNMYSGIYNNPFLLWGKYEKKLFHTYLKLSFQFHHVQMDGEEACLFLDELQKAIYAVAQQTK